MSAHITVDIKIGKEIKDSRVDSDLSLAIARFCIAKNEIDAWSEILKDLKESISEKARYFLKDEDATSLTLIAGENSVKVAFGWDINISDEATLTELLGDRFDDLVTTKISYTPTAKLKEMSLVDDGLKKCLTIKEKAAAITVVK